MKRECSNCQYWHDTSGVGQNPHRIGSCRLNPPPVQLKHTDEPDRFPETRAVDVCGHHFNGHLLRATRKNPEIVDRDHEIEWIQRQDRKEHDYFVVMLDANEELWVGGAMGIARPRSGILLAVQEGDISPQGTANALGIELNAAQGLTAYDAWTLWERLEAACDRCFVVDLVSLRWFDCIPRASDGHDY